MKKCLLPEKKLNIVVFSLPKRLNNNFKASYNQKANQKNICYYIQTPLRILNQKRGSKVADF
tara:strand:+ start:1224 stop:1409 length:186 start_codon:yes stop_codon:yes gene_type:complete